MKLFQKISLHHLAVLFFLLVIFLIPFFVFAEDDLPGWTGTTDGSGSEGMTKSILNNAADSAGYNKNSSMEDIISAATNGFLALVGTIFLIYIIYSGYLWMTAPGEEQIGKAKEHMRNAIIGIIIIVAAYAIVNFVLDALFSVGGSGGNGPIGTP